MTRRPTYPPDRQAGRLQGMPRSPNFPLLATPLLALLLATGILAACSGRAGDGAAGDAAAGNGTADNGAAGDNAAAQAEWVTIEGVEFPARMASAPPEVIEAYIFAAKHPEVLSAMPCYCGCHLSEGHDSNLDCFVNAIDGLRVDPDPMGFS